MISDVYAKALGGLLSRDLRQANEAIQLAETLEAKEQDLVRITAFSDAKVSRLLDRLQERGLVVRERQGMTNRVRLTLRQA